MAGTPKVLESSSHLFSPPSLCIYQVYLFRGEIEYLPRYVAHQGQYMEVKYRDGRKENIPGCVQVMQTYMYMYN